MAHSKVYFKHPPSGRMREAPVGFSWTTLFFGPLPALFRAHWVGFLVILITAFLTFGLSGLVFMFIYNKWYVKHLIGEGYKATEATADLDYLSQKIGMPIPREIGA